MSTTTSRQNLRHHLRVPAACPAVLRLETPAKVQIRNISRAGVMVSCERELADLLSADQKTTIRHEPTTLEIEFDLRELARGSTFVPPDSAEAAFRIAAVVAHTCRQSRDEYHVGLSYLRLTTEQQDLLDEFIEAKKGRRP
tara:strand:- start:10115 stop:10537 length:423 start_codon:yes stop_codon:yes gene_type:complete